MNIWEYGKMQAENTKEIISHKKYGIEYWYDLLETHDLYFVEFKPETVEFLVPMGYFESASVDRYKI